MLAWHSVTLAKRICFRWISCTPGVNLTPFQFDIDRRRKMHIIEGIHPRTRLSPVQDGIVIMDLNVSSGIGNSAAVIGFLDPLFLILDNEKSYSRTCIFMTTCALRTARGFGCEQEQQKT